MSSLLMLGLLALPPAPPHLLLDVAPGGGATLLTAPVDFDQVLRCQAPGTPLALDRLVAAVRTADGWRPVSVTFDPAEPGGRVGELTVFLGDDAPAGPVAVFFTGEAPVAAPSTAAGDLTVDVTDGVITVGNGFYQVTHDPARQGGLPSRFEFRPAGKVFDTVSIGDRLWDRERGSFDLNADPAPTVELAAHDALRAVVRVRARYLQAGRPAPGGAHAVYEFCYRPGSPEVLVTARIAQNPAVAWGELHFLQIHFTDTSFPGWLGPDGVYTEFTAGRASAQPAWAALADGDSLLGLLGPGTARLYDGRGEYGTYLHGPWEAWSGLERRFEKVLYLSGAADSRQAVARAADAGRRAVRTTALPETTLERLADLVDPGRPLTGWTASLLRGMAADGRLAEAHETAARLAVRSQGAAENLTWLGERTGFHLMASDQLAVAVRHPWLVSLYDLSAGREMLGAPVPLWHLTLRTADRQQIAYGAEQMPAAPAPAPAGGNRAVFEAQATVEVDGRPVLGPAVRTTIELAGPRLSVKLAIRNDSPLAVWEAESPRLALPPLGGEGTDDAVLYPLRAGVCKRNPTAGGVTYHAWYPSGGAVMQYSAMYDSVGGLYFGSHDPEASMKDVRVEGADDAGRMVLRYLWPMPDMNRPGNDWEQPGETVIELFRGDWFDASAIYRGWSETTPWGRGAATRRTPEWMPEIAVWALPNGHAYEPENVVARAKAFAEYMGVPTAIHWYNWHVIPFDDQYPHYDPPKPRMAEGVAELRAAGVRVMPYINGRLWDSRLDDFAQQARAHACWNEDGEPYIEQYGSGVPLAPMDPTTPFWQDKVREIVLWLQNEVGVDGVYIDQIGAAAPVLSFNPGPGHPLGGGSWWTKDGYWPLLGRLREGMAADRFITTEDNADPYLHLMDGYLAWAWQVPDMVPAFPAVYGGTIAMFGRAFGGNLTAQRMKVAQSLVFGEQLGWCDPGIIDQPLGPFLRAAARARHALTPFLARGTMLRPPAVSGAETVSADWAFYSTQLVRFSAVQAGAWRAADGRTALIFANCAETAQTVEVSLDPSFAPQPGTPVQPAVHGSTDAPAAVTWSPGERSTLTVPPLSVVTVILPPR